MLRTIPLHGVPLVDNLGDPVKEFVDANNKNLLIFCSLPVVSLPDCPIPTGETEKNEEINPNELRIGSRWGRIARVRCQIARQLVERYGFPLAEVARQLGVTTPAIFKAISRLSRT